MKFYHHINSSGFGGITVGYAFKDNTVIFSVAQCSEKDRYCKKIGRDIVTKKFLENENISLAVKGHKHKAQQRWQENLHYIAANLNALRNVYLRGY